MTDQLEITEIVDNVSRRYVYGTMHGKRVRVPVQAVRRTCEACGNEYWAWPDDFDRTCAKCRANHNTGGEHD